MSMSNGRYGISQGAGLCLIVFFLLLSSSSHAAAAGEAEPRIACHDQRLSVTSHSLPLVNLLDKIAKTCDVRIFSISEIKSNTVVDVEMVDQKVDKALATLLEGYNNIVVYNAGQEKAGLCLRAGMPPGYDNAVIASSPSSGRGDISPKAVSETKTGSVQKSPAAADQGDFLRSQIAMLSERIESGVSDRMYEEAIKTKDPSFVQNDRAMLASYEKRLARIEDGKK
ncbi:MAG: hypothetical protein P4L42_03160 [Desulfocapsaceae bacterium]|nr:hypothetical protein [Desulfocapsaceae bacterium]